VQTKIKKFSELTLEQYHRLLKARIAVFVVEQACAYQEVDDIDLTAIHFWFEKDQEEIVAYTRIYSDAQAIHFGRVLVPKKERGKGLAKLLVQQVTEWIQLQFPGKKIHIKAQTYLRYFYASFGFTVISEKYLEDGISHIDMEKY